MAAPESPHPFVQKVLSGLEAPARAEPGAVPELVTFEGWAGANHTRADTTTWLQFFLDVRLYQWMLVEGRRIRFTTRIEDDEKSATGGYDCIWVDADAPVGSGSGPQPIEAPFLTGAFTRAEDFKPPPVGGPSDARTGDYCAARSPLCGYCYRPPRTR